MFQHAVRSVVRNASRISNRFSSSYRPANYEPPTMDRLPIPNGSWQKAYDKKQVSYNLQLAGCLTFVVVTLIVAKTSGLFYLNWYPPEQKKQ
ncbi:PREDICTED: uncharacterized protein LOC106792067 [Polistes canadensis]|uniref:uncharacterized protein LOC106792067 n=1 Tax=Polistes canadensis TaxID=91411 RepID=UPI000718DFA5|nr:PREDICTED: uncharacterized protein LOC106792067 [Polistes canadensis]